ncbi:helix-turn-helix domain-containing protein [Gordonia sp. NPDC003422]
MSIHAFSSFAGIVALGTQLNRTTREHPAPGHHRASADAGRLGKVSASDILAVQAAASYLDVSRGTLDNWRSQGRGPAYVRQGRMIRYRRADLDAWMAQGVVRPQGAA